MQLQKQKDREKDIKYLNDYNQMIEQQEIDRK